MRSLRRVVAFATLLASCAEGPEPSTPAGPAASAASKAAAPERATIEGRVVGPRGPVKDAIVVAVPASAKGLAAGKIAATTTTGDDGRFRLELTRGTYGVTATASGARATALAGVEAPHAAVEIALGDGGVALAGVVRRDGGRVVANAKVLAIPTAGGRAFLTRADGEGRWSIALASGEYWIVPDTDEDLPDLEPRIERRRFVADETLDLALEPRAPKAPADAAPLTAWAKSDAAPIQTVDPGRGFADLAPLAKMVGDARIVALGEGTHGTHEFFRFKHRVLEYLVSERGFSVFALEAGLAESLALDDYVREGKGEPHKLLADLGVWPWDTEEVADLLAWMRRWNASHPKKVSFWGFDMQHTPAAARIVSDYLAKVDTEAASFASVILAPLVDAAPAPKFHKPSEAERDARARALRALLDRLEKGEAKMVAKSSAREHLLATQCVRVLLQNDEWRRADESGPVRDRSMAENVRWIADRAEPGARVVAWAHNGHVSFAHNLMYPMGMHLRAAYGPSYFAMGFLFGGGKFRAKDGRSAAQGKDVRVAEIALPPAQPPFVEAALARAGYAELVLDLRKPPASAAPFVSGLTLTRQADALFQGDKALEYPIVLGKNYDAIFFAAQTTPSTPTPSAKARY